jgi:membrane protease YdiL (CAAX protease family)
MGREWVARLMYRGDVLRAPWRILLFFLFLFLVSTPGQYVVSVLPRHPLEWGSRIATLVAAILASSITLYQFDRRRPGALGFGLYREAGRELATGFGIGLALIAVIAVLLLATGSLQLAGDFGSPGAYLWFLAWTLLFFALAAAVEEALFRGYPFQVLVTGIGPVAASLVSAGLFASFHALNPEVNALGMANIFLAGLLLCVAYLKTRSLWLTTGLHTAWNWTMGSLLDLPVSGLAFDTPLYTGYTAGRELLTGGGFGPEGGLIATIVLIAGTILLMRSRCLDESEPMKRLRPLVDERLGV